MVVHIALYCLPAVRTSKTSQTSPIVVFIYCVYHWFNLCDVACACCVLAIMQKVLRFSACRGDDFLPLLLHTTSYPCKFIVLEMIVKCVCVLWVGGGTGEVGRHHGWSKCFLHFKDSLAALVGNGRFEISLPTAALLCFTTMYEKCCAL